jgi:OTU domain-containing protein 6
VELGALANALERHIAVFSTDLGCLDMGEQFRGASPSLRVCYLRHAYGMGEHYNSLVAAPVAANEDDSGGEDEEEEG